MTELLSLLIKSLLAKPSCMAWPLCLLFKEAFFHPTPITSIWVFCSIEHHSANSTSAAVSPLVFVTDDIVQPSHWHWHLSFLRAIMSVLHELFFFFSFLLRVCVCVGVSGAVLGAGIVIGTQNRDCVYLQCGGKTLFQVLGRFFLSFVLSAHYSKYLYTAFPKLGHLSNMSKCHMAEPITATFLFIYWSSFIYSIDRTFRSSVKPLHLNSPPHFPPSF